MNKKKSLKKENKRLLDKLSESGIKYPKDLKKMNYEDILNLSNLTPKERIKLMLEMQNHNKHICDIKKRKYNYQMHNTVQGAVFYANLSNGIGSEQKGIRPVIIIQNNNYNSKSPTVIVAPITTKSDKKSAMITHIPIHNDYENIDCMVLVEQILTIDTSRLLCYMYNATDKVMNDINNALSFLFSVQNSD